MHVYILHTRIYCMYMHVDACRCICICMWICMYIYSIHVIDCMYMHVDACICMWLYACIYYMHRSTKYQQTYIGLGRCWGAGNLEFLSNPEFRPPMSSTRACHLPRRRLRHGDPQCVQTTNRLLFKACQANLSSDRGASSSESPPRCMCEPSRSASYKRSRTHQWHDRS